MSLVGLMNWHRKLEVWQLAGRLIDIVYAITRRLPAEERYAASTQIRRAAWSVQNNIAEGYARLGPDEQRRFFDISLGSLAEVDSMSAKLSDLYEIEHDALRKLEHLRQSITGLLFAMIRRKRR